MRIDFYAEFEGIELDQAEALITSQFRNIFDRAYVAIKSENDGISVSIEQPVPQYNEYDVEFIIQALYDYVPVLGQMGVFIDQQTINVSFTDEKRVDPQPPRPPFFSIFIPPFTGILSF